MNDELVMVRREQRGTVPMTTPVEQIISRGRAVRVRRRVPGVAAALGAAAAVTVAVSVALPASGPAATHPASGPGARLAAWTVTRQSDGSIQVSFFGQLRDPAGLQRTLRADGDSPAASISQVSVPRLVPFPAGLQLQPQHRPHPPATPPRTAETTAAATSAPGRPV
jgi:hypothetical protein